MQSAVAAVESKIFCVNPAVHARRHPLDAHGCGEHNYTVDRDLNVICAHTKCRHRASKRWALRKQNVLYD